jgi:predicted DNA-binding transcriptional regulator AlpA
VRVADIARLLGVSQQRADQLTREVGFPKASARKGRSRVWRLEDVDGWALEVE